MTSAWRPIETAPKGGRAVLIAWESDAGDWEIHSAYQFCYGNEDNENVEAWAFAHSGHMLKAYRPTHWQPLPEPPDDDSEAVSC